MAGPGADAPASAPGAGTFVFADIAGFTALTEAHGDHRAAELADDFAEDVRGWLDRRGGGQVVKTIGDAVMVRCDTAAAAVELGLRVIGESGATHGSPMVRVGMHSGQAVERRGDYFGGVVNLAARVAGIAAGGQVLLSDATRTLLADDDRFATEDLGPIGCATCRIRCACTRSSASERVPAPGRSTRCAGWRSTRHRPQ